MELNIPQKKSFQSIKMIKRYGWIGGLVAVLTFGVFHLTSQAKNTYVPRAELSIGTVQSGAFSIESRGTGVFKPMFSLWVSAKSTATVEELWVSSGETVHKGQTIMTLSNPLLQQEVDNHQWTIPTLEAEIQKATFEKNEVLLEQQILLVDLELKNEKLKQKVKTEEGLRKKGHATLTNQAWNALKKDWNHTTTSLKLEQQRYDAIRDSERAGIAMLKIKLQQAQGDQKILNERLEHLTVKASRNGIVQALPVEVGQQVAQGNPLFRLASADEFYAEIKINQDDIAQVEVGQSVVVRNRRGTIDGQVRRIDGAVDQGSVKVEVDLTSALPSGIRADQRLDATVIIAQLNQSVYVERPAFVQAENKGWVYRLNPTDDSVKRIQVGFGKAGVQNIQIVDGLAPGDQIVLSEPGVWRNQSEIFIK